MIMPSDVILNVIMLSVILLNVIMLSVIILNIIMLSVILLNVIMLNVIMLNVIAECHYAECHYAECHYAECRYAECRYAECRGAFFQPNEVLQFDFETGRQFENLMGNLREDICSSLVIVTQRNKSSLTSKLRYMKSTTGMEQRAP